MATEVAFYRFDGDATDAGPNGYNGTAHSVTYITGKVGQAASFNGSSSYVDLGSSAGSFGVSDAFSYAFWIKSSSSGVIMGRGSGTSHGYALALSSGIPAITFTYGLPGSVTATASYASIADGAWHHVVFTYDGSGTTGGVGFYVDGTPAGIAGSSASIPSDFAYGGSTTVGAVNASWFAGAVDELGIYAGVLTSADVSGLISAAPIPASAGIGPSSQGSGSHQASASCTASAGTTPSPESWGSSACSASCSATAGIPPAPAGSGSHQVSGTVAASAGSSAPGESWGSSSCSASAGSSAGITPGAESPGPLMASAGLIASAGVTPRGESWGSSAASATAVVTPGSAPSGESRGSASAGPLAASCFAGILPGGESSPSVSVSAPAPSASASAGVSPSPQGSGSHHASGYEYTPGMALEQSSMGLAASVSNVKILSTLSAPASTVESYSDVINLASTAISLGADINPPEATPACNCHWSGDVLVPAGGVATLDKTALPPRPPNVVAGFTATKVFVVIVPAGAPNSLYIVGGSTPWLAPWPGSAGAGSGVQVEEVPPGWPFLKVRLGSGWPVDASTKDLRLANPGSSPITAKVILIGVTDAPPF